MRGTSLLQSVFPPEHPQTSGREDDRLKVVSMFERGGALERLRRNPQRIRPAFEPIVDLRRGTATGYEAVLGYDREPPARPADWSRQVHARHAGAVEAVLVAAALATRERLPAGAWLLLNVSAQALISSELGEALRAAGRLDGVVVMVTDDSEGDEAYAVREALEAVRDAGGGVGVDETGSGYASLKQLLRLRPGYVRVGGDFVAEVDRDQAKAAVVEALAGLASRIDAAVVGAGIDGPQELQALKRMGVPFGQGPLFGAASNDMRALSPETAQMVADTPPGPDADRTVAALVEPMPGLAWDAGLEDVADAFLADPRNDVIVLLDERSRPLALAERAALLRGEPYERAVMRITARSPLKAVARRAAARSSLERYHPLVVCDRHGVYQGIVRVESLLDALAL